MASEHSGQGRRNRLLAALTSEDHSLLAPHLKEMSLEVGLLLQEAGKPIEYVYFPHHGMISLLAVMSDGRGIEPATVGSEGVVGASPDSASAGALRGRSSRPPWWPHVENKSRPYEVFECASQAARTILEAGSLAWLTTAPPVAS